MKRRHRVQAVPEKRATKPSRAVRRLGRTPLIPHALNPSWWCCPIHGALPNDSVWVNHAIFNRKYLKLKKPHHYVAYQMSSTKPLPHPTVIAVTSVHTFDLLCPYEPHILRGYMHNNIVWKLTPGRTPKFYTPEPGEEVWPVLAVVFNSREAVSGPSTAFMDSSVQRTMVAALAERSAGTGSVLSASSEGTLSPHGDEPVKPKKKAKLTAPKPITKLMWPKTAENLKALKVIAEEQQRRKNLPEYEILMNAYKFLLWWRRGALLIASMGDEYAIAQGMMAKYRAKLFSLELGQEATAVTVARKLLKKYKEA